MEQFTKDEMLDILIALECRILDLAEDEELEDETKEYEILYDKVSIIVNQW